MATMLEVMIYLRPNGGYVTRGENFEDIEFIDCEPFTKEEFLAAFDAYDEWLVKEEADKQAKRANTLAKLEVLGLDEDDLKALGL